MKGTSPSLGGSTAAFSAFFSVCFSLLVENLLIFVLVVVGISAVGCTGGSNESKLGWAMYGKARPRPWGKHYCLLRVFAVCYSHLVGNSVIFVSVVVGITAVGCTGRSNKPKLGVEMT